jgi:hypothetical protein
LRFLAIYSRTETSVPPSPDDMARMDRFVDESKRKGILIATEGCMPTSHGARVRISGSHFTTTDGPFTESKEVVAGFALLAAPSKEAALQYTRDFLEFVGEGECELRQIYE